MPFNHARRDRLRRTINPKRPGTGRDNTPDQMLLASRTPRQTIQRRYPPRVLALATTTRALNRFPRSGLLSFDAGIKKTYNQLYFKRYQTASRKFAHAELALPRIFEERSRYVGTTTDFRCIRQTILPARRGDRGRPPKTESNRCEATVVARSICARPDEAQDFSCEDVRNYKANFYHKIIMS